MIRDRSCYRWPFDAAFARRFAVPRQRGLERRLTGVKISAIRDIRDGIGRSAILRDVIAVLHQFGPNVYTTVRYTAVKIGSEYRLFYAVTPSRAFGSILISRGGQEYGRTIIKGDRVTFLMDH